ncbi:MAG: SRPBCC family protein [Planctomycetota bacterium]
MHTCLATKLESTRPFPGDDRVESPGVQSTHAITIAASPAEVWPWLVQIGQDRGGFYSYTLLENLFGCRMRNADHIHAAWQTLAVGDGVQIHPRFPPLVVTSLTAGHHLVLMQHAPLPWTWAFQLLAIGQAGCRLLVRTRVARAGCLTSVWLLPVMTVGHYVMERRMLIGIKDRSEAEVTRSGGNEASSRL